MFSYVNALYARALCAMGAQYWSLRTTGSTARNIVYMGAKGTPQTLQGKVYSRATEGFVNPHYSQKRLVWAERVQKLVESLAEVPPFTLLFQSALYLYALLFTLTKMGVQRRRGRGLLWIPLAYGIGLCFVPISGSVRYAFPIFSAAPILCLLGLAMPAGKRGNDFNKNAV